MAAVIQPTKTMNDLPGPRGLPLVGNLFQLDKPRLHQQLEQWARDFGPIFRLRIGPVERVIISHSEIIHDMLRARPDQYRRPQVTEAVMAEMGFHGVFSADGEAWQRQRKVIAQALNPAHLNRFYPAMRNTTERLRTRWLSHTESGENIDVCRDLMRYTVDVTAHLAFGVDVNTLETDGPVIQQHLDKVFPMLFRRVVAPFPTWRYWQSAADRELNYALAEIRETVDGFILTCRQRMANNPELFAQPGNFLEAILAAQRSENVQFSEEELYANIITLLLAGEDTTANTIAWAINFFAKHPELMASAREESDRVLGNNTSAADMATIRELDFIEAFAMETMRFKPVAPLLGLEPKQDVNLLGYQIKAGTGMLALTRPGALEEANFSHADSFKPERWQNANECPAGNHNTRAFIPFGAGPRFCPGRGLALVEIKSVLAMLCRNFDLEIATDTAQTAEELAFTMFPSNLTMRVSARQ